MFMSTESPQHWLLRDKDDHGVSEIHGGRQIPSHTHSSGSNFSRKPQMTATHTPSESSETLLRIATALTKLFVSRSTGTMVMPD